MSMRVSMLKRSIRPRTRSLMRGWVTPRRSATFAWVMRREAMAFWTLIMRSARTRRCSASSSENPRSRNTLPLDAVTLDFITHLSSRRPALSDHHPKAMPRKFHVSRGRLARALFEGVKHVYALGELGDIQDAMFEPGVNSYLPSARPHGRHWPPVVRIEPALDTPQLIAGDGADRLREPPEVVPRAADPLQRLVHHRLIYKSLHSLSITRLFGSPNNVSGLPPQVRCDRVCA